MTEKSESIVHEAARDGIRNLVDIFSTSISAQAKRQRLRRIADDLIQALEQSTEAE